MLSRSFQLPLLHLEITLDYDLELNHFYLITNYFIFTFVSVSSALPFGIYLIFQKYDLAFRAARLKYSLNEGIKFYSVASLSIFYCNLGSLKICVLKSASQLPGTNAKTFHYISCDTGIFMPILSTRKLKHLVMCGVQTRLTPRAYAFLLLTSK